ncbi:mitotic-spindle organizing protein associated with a ring of gamma-tubulin 1 [Penicillium lividum]|nr:mitotic-spindle organizing protein associated with a ring of gamma-tubulin 1 [Penicillium lividum]
MPTDADNKRQAARDVIDILEDISKILNTNLTRTELSLCVSLIENGVNPDALAAVVKDLRKESATVSSGQ